MKVAILGAGNVGSTAAFCLLQKSFVKELVLVDVAREITQGKAADLEDSRYLLENNTCVYSGDINQIKAAEVVVLTAGMARQPGMTREQLRDKNAEVVKELVMKVKELAPSAILLVVTNPLDLMTYLAFKLSGFERARVFGMGANLDAARFANLISLKLKTAVSQIEPMVIGPHGEGMLPLGRFTKVRGVTLDKILSAQEIDKLAQDTVKRGAYIVSLLGRGSAYYAPAAAICNLISAIAEDRREIIPVSVYLEGEYGLRELCIGVPAVIGRDGIEGIVELPLNEEEKEAFLKAAAGIQENIKHLAL